MLEVLQRRIKIDGLKYSEGHLFETSELFMLRQHYAPPCAMSGPLPCALSACYRNAHVGTIVLFCVVVKSFHFFYTAAS